MSSQDSKGPDSPDLNGSQPLFYAYARRTDHANFSRYLLTFASAAIAREWWDLVKEEFPDSKRENLQLFSLTGDNKVGAIWANKKLDHLKTKWMYSQLGDATGTGGRQQDIIPVQGSNGEVLARAGDGPASSAQADSGAQASSPNLSELVSAIKDLKTSFASNQDELVTAIKDQKTSAASNQGASIDLTELLAAIKDLHSTVKQNGEQTKRLAIRQIESLDGLRKVMDSDASQKRGRTDSHQTSSSPSLDRLTELAEQNAEQLQQLSKQLSQTTTQIQALRAGQADLVAVSDDLVLAARDYQGTNAGSVIGSSVLGSSCGHSIRPPPRKLNRKLTGYVYEDTNGAQH